MKEFDQMARDNGKCSYEGREYVLTEQAYADYVQGNTPEYTALAVRPGDLMDEDGFLPAYEVRWTVLNSYLEDTERLSDCNPGDESDACDWDSPDSVREVAGWCAEDGRIV